MVEDVIKELELRTGTIKHLISEPTLSSVAFRKAWASADSLREAARAGTVILSKKLGRTIPDWKERLQKVWNADDLP